VAEEPTAVVEQPKPAETPAPPVITPAPAKEEKSFFRVWEGDEIKALPNELPDGSKAEEQPPLKIEEKPAEKPPEPKTYAGKFKGEEELEKGYTNLESEFTRKSQELAEANRKLAEVNAGKATQTAATQTATEVTAQAAAQPDIADMILNRPMEFVDLVSKRAAQQTQVQLETQQVTHDWLDQNKDLADRQHLVGAEMQKILQSDPEKAKAFAEGRGNQRELLAEATGRVRNWIGEITTAAKKEALTTKETIASLGVSSVSQTQPNPTVTGAAPKEIDALDDALAEARRERSRTMGVSLPRR